MQFTTVRAKLQEGNTTAPLSFREQFATNNSTQFELKKEKKTFPAYDAHYGALFLQPNAFASFV